MKTPRQRAAYLRNLNLERKRNRLRKWKLKQVIESMPEIPTKAPSGYDPQTFFVIHRTTDKTKRWQCTQFDEHGPVGDIRGDFKTIARKAAGIYPNEGMSRMSFPAPHWADWRRAMPLEVQRTPGRLTSLTLEAPNGLSTYRYGSIAKGKVLLTIRESDGFQWGLVSRKKLKSEVANSQIRSLKTKGWKVVQRHRLGTGL